MVLSPQILIEWLNDVMRLGRGLTEAEREREFGIRQVTDDLMNAPLSGSDGMSDAFRAEGASEAYKLLCRTGYHFERVTIT
jgi:hypothetical protein